MLKIFTVELLLDTTKVRQISECTGCHGTGCTQAEEDFLSPNWLNWCTVNSHTPWCVSLTVSLVV